MLIILLCVTGGPSYLDNFRKFTSRVLLSSTRGLVINNDVPLPQSSWMRAGSAVSSHGLEYHTWGSWMTWWKAGPHLTRLSNLLLHRTPLRGWFTYPPSSLEDIFCSQTECSWVQTLVGVSFGGPSSSLSNQRELDPLKTVGLLLRRRDILFLCPCQVPLPRVWFSWADREMWLCVFWKVQVGW